MQRVVNIPEDIVSAIEKKDLKYQALKDTYKELVETHALDENTSFLDSPVVTKLMEKITDARKDWEDAKNAMALKYISETDSKRVSSWNLNYGTCELTLTMNN